MSVVAWSFCFGFLVPAMCREAVSDTDVLTFSG